MTLRVWMKAEIFGTIIFLENIIKYLHRSTNERKFWKNVWKSNNNNNKAFESRSIKLCEKVNYIQKRNYEKAVYKVWLLRNYKTNHPFNFVCNLV